LYYLSGAWIAPLPVAATCRLRFRIVVANSRAAASSGVGLVLPPAANPAGLGALGDVVITLNLTTRFSPALFQTMTGAPLTDTTKIATPFGELSIDSHA
jgi:hypothetical protein